MTNLHELHLPKQVSNAARLNFCVPTICPQAWVWINGEYVGRRKYLETYIRPAGLDVPITGTGNLHPELLG